LWRASAAGGFRRLWRVYYPLFYTVKYRSDCLPRTKRSVVVPYCRNALLERR